MSTCPFPFIALYDASGRCLWTWEDGWEESAPSEEEEPEPDRPNPNAQSQS